MAKFAPREASNPGQGERILAYGGSGAGKTKGWLDIAQAYHDADVEGEFYVLDTDMAVDRMIDEGYPDIRDRVHVVVPLDFDEYKAFAVDLKKNMGPLDWAVVDLMDVSWEEAQNYYSEQIYGEDKASYFVAKRKSMKNPNKENFFDGSTDWQVIKPIYERFSQSVFYRHRGHTYVTAGAAPVSRSGGSWGDSKETINTFGHVGLKPTGNKRLMHNVHTAIMFEQTSSGWILTSAKDRERELLKKADVDNFAEDYLMQVAGWKKKKEKLTVAERKAQRKGKK